MHSSIPSYYQEDSGFTLMELIMIILLISVLSVIAVVKWPDGLDEDAARLEFRQAVRYAQSMALTREWDGADRAWGITVASNRYYVGRADANCVSDCSQSGCADAMYCGRALLGDTGLTLTDGTVLFNGLGEPILDTGALLGNTSFTVAGSVELTVCSQTGYVLDGGSCP